MSCARTLSGPRGQRLPSAPARGHRTARQPSQQNHTATHNATTEPKFYSQPDRRSVNNCGKLPALASLVFVFEDVDRAISEEEARWLFAELLAADDASNALASHLEEAHSKGECVETTLEEKRKLVQLFERSTRARSHDLRALEIALHAAVFAAG